MASKAEKYTEEDRKFAQERGNKFNLNDEQRADVARQKRAGTENWMAEQYDPMLGGRGGYNEQEASDIRGNFDDIAATDEELKGNFYTSDEQQRIRGNPWARAAYYDPESEMARTYESGGRVRGAADQYGQEINAAIDPSQLGLSEGYAGDQQGILNRTGSDIRGAVDPALLRADSAALDAIRMSPEERQRMVTGAGITAGLGYSQATDDAMRRGRAAGMNPMGLAAVRGRNENNSAVAKGNAMTLARIAAGDAYARRAGTAEDYRMRGEESAADRVSRAALEAGQFEFGGASDLENQRLGTARDISGRRMDAASQAGRARMTAEEANAQRETQARQFNTRTGTDIATGIEQDEQAREQGLATNRQNVNATNQGTKYNQRVGIQQAKQAGAQQIADKRIDAQYRGQDWLDRQQAQQYGEENAGYNRQAGIYGEQGSQMQGTTKNQMTHDAQPKLWEKIGGLAVAGVGAATGTGLIPPIKKKPT